MINCMYLALVPAFMDGADDSVQGTVKTSLLLAKSTVKRARVIFAPMLRLTVAR